MNLMDWEIAFIGIIVLATLAFLIHSLFNAERF